MRWIATVGLLACSYYVNAESLICVPEITTAAVDEGNHFESGPLAQGKFFILSNDGGDWSLRLIPDNKVFFEHCYSEYYCDSGGNEFGGAFLRERTNDEKSKFTAIWLSANLHKNIASTAKGYCTKI